MASPTAANNAQAVNLDATVNSLVVPFASSGSSQVNVVFVAVRSTVATVQSVTDNVGNTYTKKASVVANEEVDYSQGHYSKDPIIRGTVDVEVWTTKATTGTVSAITVTLSSPAKFAVAIEGFSGSALGNAGQSAIGDSSNPGITVTTATNGSWLVAGFGSPNGLAQKATAGSVDHQSAGSNTDRGVSIVTAHILQATAGSTTVSIEPVQTTTQDGATFPIITNYAAVAVEVKG